MFLHYIYWAAISFTALFVICMAIFANLAEDKETELGFYKIAAIGLIALAVFFVQ